ncbi:MBL fold metallo-hydrolase [Haloimpatiens lingqiaonensis]|uniref:MBL fold metallo-hydrolase n=1 Tax=Haloimpatiens lingqiaonensis TaxID=1380675 RepID=UPI0010FE4E51|nr:MBL fold metallo-hydrolase [Haloimpatiens lingqiaonensis]
MIFCPLYSGSSGNSVFIGTDKTKILVDAGLPGKHIENALKDIGEKPEEIDGIFVTHEHIDHIKGVGVLSRKYDIPIYANADTWDAMNRNIGKIKEHNIKIFQSAHTEIKDLDILNFSISHDAANPNGYVICYKQKKACIATDLGHFSKEVKDSINDCEVILLESNHDVEMLKFGPYPYNLKRRILSNVGHLSNDDCGRAIVDIMKDKKKTIFLGHLSNTNNQPDLAYQTVLNILNDNGLRQGIDIELKVAERSKPSGCINF